MTNMLAKSLVLLTVWIVVLSVYVSSVGASGATITVDPQTRYQTIEGWEAVAQACEFDCSSFSSFSSSLFDQATADLGINRLRVEIRATSSTSTTFDLSRFDQVINLVVLPIRQRLAARGEHLWVNVIFSGNSGFPAQPDQSAYAQQVLVTYQHLQQTYGFLPDSWEIVLEPGAVSKNWTPSLIADAVRKSDALLKANGFTPFFIIPSSACGASTALSDFNGVLSANNGALPPDVKEFAYHRYCAPSTSDLQNVAGLRSRYGISTAMLEHGGATFTELYQDLTVANVSAWEQYTLAYPATSTQYAGYQYYNLPSTSSTSVSLDWRAKWLRQVFKFVRAGAVRVGVSATSGTVAPVAFVNTDGRYVVVVWNTTWGGQTFTIQGLPAGTYGIVYTTGDTYNNNISAYNVTLSDVTLASGQSLTQTLPDQGVMTIFGKSGPAATGTASVTPTASRTSTPTVASSPRATSTPTLTSVPTKTNTPSSVDRVPASATPTLASQPTATSSPTPNSPVELTATPTFTTIPTVANTATSTRTPELTATPTITPVATMTSTPTPKIVATRARGVARGRGPKDR